MTGFRVLYKHLRLVLLFAASVPRIEVGSCLVVVVAVGHTRVTEGYFAPPENEYCDVC